VRLITATLFAILAMSGSLPAVAQNPTHVPSRPDGRESATKDYSGLVTDLFAPITASLRLSREQEFQIIAIISGSEVTAEPLVQRFEEVDHELASASFAESLDEAKVRELSEQEATMLSELISLKVFAKARIFQVLTPEQKALVAQQFRVKDHTEGNIGAISIY